MLARFNKARLVLDSTPFNPTHALTLDALEVQPHWLFEPKSVHTY